MAATTAHRINGPERPPTDMSFMDVDQPPVLPPLQFDQPVDDLAIADWDGRAPSSPPIDQKGELTNLELAAMFEHRCRAWVAAINAKDFGPNSAIWQDKTPNWRSRLVCNYMKGPSESMNVHDFVDSLQKASKMNPGVYMNILDCTTNLYRSENGRIEFAETFLNLEVTGVPPGITRRSVAVHNSRLIGGKWLGVSHKSLPGMVVMGPDCMY